MNTRIALVAAVVVALALSAAPPSAAQARAKTPTAAEVAQVRQAIADYRRMWTSELNAEERGIARQYGAPTPEDLERMLREWEAGRGSKPTVPGSVPGKSAARKTTAAAPARPASPPPSSTPLPPPPPPRMAPARPAPARSVSPAHAPVAPAPPAPAPDKPGEEAPDFVNGAPKEALDNLKDAKIDLDDIRDKVAEDANCSPEARSSKQALQAKLQVYRQALTDLDSANQQVRLANGAGDTLELATQFGGAANAVKATADAAMDLFGAAASLLPPSAKPLKTSMETVGAFYNVANGVGSALSADNDLSGAAGLVGAQANITKLQAMTLSESQQKRLNVAVAGGELLAKGFDTAALKQDKSVSADSRLGETAGNGVQAAGTILTQVGELTSGKVETPVPNMPSTIGAAASALGTVMSASTKYDRELGKAFDTIAAGKDEKREYNALNAASQRQNEAKRVEFMQKIAELEAEISRSGCKQ